MTSMNEKNTSRGEHLPQLLSFALAGLLLAGAELGGTSQTVQAAEAYPQRPIRLIVPSLPGGALDAVGRIVGSTLEEALGQRIVVDNRPGGGGVIGTELAARANPDGYNLLIVNVSFTTMPGLLKKLPYDPIKDFSPISLFAKSPLIFVVPPSLGVSTIRELIKLAKSRPGQFNLGSAQLGSSGHMAAELLMWKAGIDLVRISYKGAAQALIDLVAGRIHVMCTSPLPAMPHVKTGKLRALAQTDSTRSPAMPDIPTVAETVPGYESTTWYALLAPAATPPPVIKQLYLEMARIARSPTVSKILVTQGAEPIGSSPQELAKFLITEIDRWTEVIERAKIRPGEPTLTDPKGAPG